MQAAAAGAQSPSASGDDVRRGGYAKAVVTQAQRKLRHGKAVKEADDLIACAVPSLSVREESPPVT